MDNVSTSLIGSVAIGALVWYLMQVIADWKILSKAGKPGWLSLIPVVNVYAEYGICWQGLYGIVYLILLAVGSRYGGNGAEAAEGSQSAVVAIAGLAGAVIHIIQSLKLARSFGKGTFYGIMLILFGPIARVILGLGSSEYIGKP